MKTVKKDYNLVESIQKNKDDSLAFEKLLNNYSRMIRKIISSYSLENGAFMVDVDELYQEGSLALYKAARTFDMERGIEFSTYAYRVISNNIITRLREMRRRGSQDQLSIDSYYNPDYTNIMAVADSAIDYMKTSRMNEDLELFLQSLSNEDRKYLKLREEGLSYKQIAIICNTDVKRIDNRLSSIRKRMKSFLGQNR